MTRTPLSGAVSILLALAHLNQGTALVVHRHKAEQPAAAEANATWQLFPSGSLPGPVPTGVDLARARFWQAELDVSCKVSYPRGNTYMVKQPSLVPYLVDMQHPRRKNASVIVFPGGGKVFLAWEREGHSVAQWLNSIGVSAFVARYRVPAPMVGSDAMLIDAQRAVSLLRHRAASLGLSPHHIGVMGFSAGATLLPDLVSASARVYPSTDEADEVSFRPDFQMLIYGFGPQRIEEGEPRPPPTFVVNARDDPCVDARRGESYCQAVVAVGQSCELHMYPTGGHGYGTCAIYTNNWTGTSVCDWTREAEGFLSRMAES